MLMFLLLPAMLLVAGLFVFLPVLPVVLIVAVLGLMVARTLHHHPNIRPH